MQMQMQMLVQVELSVLASRLALVVRSVGHLILVLTAGQRLCLAWWRHLQAEPPRSLGVMTRTTTAMMLVMMLRCVSTRA